MRRYHVVLAVLAVVWLFTPSPVQGQLRTVELFAPGQKGSCDCAQVIASLGKIAGVESVREHAGPLFATLQMRSQNAVRLQQIWDVLRNHDTRADEVRLKALGHLEYSGTGQLQFVIRTSGETYDLVSTEASRDVCTDILLGRQVLLNGTIPVSKLRVPSVIRFESLVEAESESMK